MSLASAEKVTFHKAAAGDAGSLCGFINRAYRGDYAKQGWTTESDLLGGQRVDEPGLRDLLAEPESSVVLARGEDGSLLGCVHLRREPRGSCYLGMLTVEPKLQGAGLGKKLLAESERVALGWGCRCIRMTVISVRSELIAFYQRRGYRPTGSFEPFPEHDPRFGLPKVGSLRFIELEKSLAPAP